MAHYEGPSKIPRVTKVAAIILAETTSRKWAPEDVKNYRSVAKKMGAEIVYEDSDFEVRDLRKVQDMLAMKKKMPSG